MDFSDALRELKAGKRLARKGWNGKGMWIRLALLKIIDNEKYPYRPFLEIKGSDDILVPWVASQTDLLADDWEIVE